MTGMRKYWMYIGIPLGLIVGMFFSHAYVFADTQQADAYMTSIVSKLYGKTLKDSDAVPQIIEHFCSTVLTSEGFNQNDYTYDAKQSTFVYLLCTTARHDGHSLFENTPKLFTRTTFKQLGLEDIPDDSNNIDYCSPMSSDCDLAIQLPTLFNDIITDYVNMKQANIYGLIWNFADDEEMEAQINIFSLANFNIKLCENGVRTYSSTCRAMKRYLKNARNLLSDVHIFNASGILDIVKPKAQLNAKNVFEIPFFTVSPKPAESIDDCASNKGKVGYDMFLCGLYGDTATSMDSFIKLVYNELFYYRLFMGYYLMILQQHPKILSNNTYNTSYSTIVKKFTSQYNRSTEALSLTLRMMRDTYMAYPLHIGFLMYQEDLDGFGKLIAKIATPIYTLYDKLRNVQKPE